MDQHSDLDESQLPWNDQHVHNKLIRGLYDQFMTSTLTDVTLVVGDREIHCHRSVLAAGSKYFRVMFTNGMVEMTQSRIPIHDLDPDTVAAIVKYMYTSKINVCPETAQDLLTAANLFDIIEIVKDCAYLMEQELKRGNCFGILQFARFHNCKRLYLESRRFVVNHFSWLATTPELAELCFIDFLSIIFEDRLNIREEELAYESVIHWLEHDLDNRLCHLEALFGEVRLGLIAKSYIEQHISRKDYIMSNDKCQQMVTNALLFHSDNKRVFDEDQKYDIKIQEKSGKRDIDFEEGEKDTDAEEYEEPEIDPRYIAREAHGELLKHTDIPLPKDNEQTTKTEPRCTKRIGMHMREMFVFVGGTHTDPNNRALTCIDPKTGRCYSVIPFCQSAYDKRRIDFHRVVVTPDNRIWCIGGILYTQSHYTNRGTPLNTTCFYSYHLNNWYYKQPLQLERCQHTATYNRGKIYVTGGRSYYGRDTTNTCEVYDVEADTWTFFASLPYECFLHSADVYNDHLYVCMGKHILQAPKQVFFEYSIANDTWTQLMPTFLRGRMDFGHGIINDKLYIFGGSTKTMRTKKMEVYDFKSKTWSEGKKCFRPQTSYASVVYKGKLYAFGGSRLLPASANGNIYTIPSCDAIVFDPEKNEWDTAPRTSSTMYSYSVDVAEINMATVKEHFARRPKYGRHSDLTYLYDDIYDDETNYYGDITDNEGREPVRHESDSEAEMDKYRDIDT